MNLEPIDELVRLMGMGEEHDDVPALPDWVEDYFADQRRYWRTLRDDGLIDLADTGELIRRQVDRAGLRAYLEGQDQRPARNDRGRPRRLLPLVRNRWRRIRAVLRLLGRGGAVRLRVRRQAADEDFPGDRCGAPGTATFEMTFGHVELRSRIDFS